MCLPCSHLPRLPELLESVDIELKIGAGEALALLYELAREQDEVSIQPHSQPSTDLHNRS